MTLNGLAVRGATKDESLTICSSGNNLWIWLCEDGGDCLGFGMSFLMKLFDRSGRGSFHGMVVRLGGDLLVQWPACGWLRK